MSPLTKGHVCHMLFDAYQMHQRQVFSKSMDYLLVVFDSHIYTVLYITNNSLFDPA